MYRVRSIPTLFLIDSKGKVVRFFGSVCDEQALRAAREAAREIAAGDYRGPLHGVPVAVKDLLAMAGTPTTAGSRILADWTPDFDAAGVERLRAAGAIIVGKTRMSEFAYSPGSNNAHYGPTRNPWNLEHDTGGSSSGSGSAVAAGLVFGALGSDTGGSIRIPASLCGIAARERERLAVLSESVRRAVSRREAWRGTARHDIGPRPAGTSRAARAPQTFLQGRVKQWLDSAPLFDGDSSLRWKYHCRNSRSGRCYSLQTGVVTLTRLRRFLSDSPRGNRQNEHVPAATYCRCAGLLRRTLNGTDPA